MSAQARGDLAWRFRAAWRFKTLSPFRDRENDRFARPAYCAICGCWSWSTWEIAPYSTAHGFLCSDCEPENSREVDAAWREYYSGLL